MSTPQPFDTQNRQVTAMQYTTHTDLPTLTDWMQQHGTTIHRALPSPRSLTAHLSFHTDLKILRRFILNPGDWVVYDGVSFYKMTDHHFTTYHHTATTKGTR